MLSNHARVLGVDEVAHLLTSLSSVSSFIPPEWGLVVPKHSVATCGIYVGLLSSAPSSNDVADLFGVVDDYLSVPPATPSTVSMFDASAAGDGKRRAALNALVNAPRPAVVDSPRSHNALYEAIGSNYIASDHRTRRVARTRVLLSDAHAPNPLIALPNRGHTETLRMLVREAWTGEGLSMSTATRNTGMLAPSNSVNVALRAEVLPETLATLLGRRGGYELATSSRMLFGCLQPAQRPVGDCDDTVGVSMPVELWTLPTSFRAFWAVCSNYEAQLGLLTGRDERSARPVVALDEQTMSFLEEAGDDHECQRPVGQRTALNAELGEYIGAYWSPAQSSGKLYDRNPHALLSVLKIAASGLLLLDTPTRLDHPDYPDGQPLITWPLFRWAMDVKALSARTEESLLL